MNYSEIQIEELRQLILDNSVDPSIVTVDDCAELLYHEVERKYPSNKIIEFCNNIIKTSNEYKNISIKDFNTSYNDFFSNKSKHINRSFKLILIAAATLILLPFVFITTVYAIKYIYGLITDLKKEKLTIYESNPIIKSTEYTDPNDYNQDVFIDDISLLPIHIKSILPNSIYIEYSFIYCSIYKDETISEYDFRFNEDNNILISFYQINESTNYYATELPKEAEAICDYYSVQEQKYYICKNEEELTAVSINNNIIVSIYGNISLEEIKKLIDLIEIPQVLP